MMVMNMDSTDRAIVNALQGGFPLTERPYRDAALALGLAEDELIERIRRLLDDGVLTRFGPLYNADRMGGAAVLAAIPAAAPDVDWVAGVINAQPEIAHNYRREHFFNLWFVAAAESEAKVASAFERIERETGYPVYRFPKEREYFVELKLQA
jgi:DNA-binding Lrp family transcriptional regulator